MKDKARSAQGVLISVLGCCQQVHGRVASKKKNNSIAAWFRQFAPAKDSPINCVKHRRVNKEEEFKLPGSREREVMDRGIGQEVAFGPD